MKFVDYYKVLGVEREVSAEELSKAYKKRARRLHPDLNKSPGAEAKFKDLNEAYDVLKDPEKRKRYDLLGADWKHGAPFEPPPGFQGGGSQGGGSQGGGFSDFFEAFFGSRGGPRAGGGRGGGAGFDLGDLFGGRGSTESFGGGGGAADVESELRVEIEESYRGSKKNIELTGDGHRRRYEVTIPRGIREGEKIRLAGQGQGRGRSRGDLYLTVRFAPHALFRVDGDDLLVTVPVQAWDAALGCRVPVPTLEGEVQMTLPPGQSSGQRLRLRGKGMPRRDGGQGDLYAELKVTVPKQLNAEQEELFQRLRKLAP